MSNYADRCETLREKLVKYSGNDESIKVVVDIFYSMITDEGWDSDDSIGILSSGKGISVVADIELDKCIALEHAMSLD